MATRVCAGPNRDQDCPDGALVDVRAGSRQTRCPLCRASYQRQRDAQRGTRQQRGYDAEHDHLRAALIATYAPSDPCARCGQPLGPDPTVLDLGHTDDRRGYRGLEHAACNRSAGARLASRR
jgi:hypothetical protein